MSHCTGIVKWLKPQIESVTKGYVQKIFVKPNSKISVGDLIMTFETDKVVMEERAILNGTITDILVQIDQTVFHKTPLYKIVYKS